MKRRIISSILDHPLLVYKITFDYRGHHHDSTMSTIISRIGKKAKKCDLNSQKQIVKNIETEKQRQPSQTL